MTELVKRTNALTVPETDALMKRTTLERRRQHLLCGHCHRTLGRHTLYYLPDRDLFVGWKPCAQVTDPPERA